MPKDAARVAQQHLEDIPPERWGIATNTYEQPGHYLRVVSHLVFAYLWARMAKVALAKVDGGDPFYAAKLATARFYIAKLLPETAMLIRSARAGLSPLMSMDEALF